MSEALPSWASQILPPGQSDCRAWQQSTLLSAECKLQNINFKSEKRGLLLKRLREVSSFRDGLQRIFVEVCPKQ